MRFNNTNDIWSRQMIVSAYCRVSTDKEDQVNSLESQIKYFTEYILGHKNWAMGEIYYDEGITGTSVKKRKAFNRMIQDGLSGKYHLIITKEVSRFARNTIDTLLYTRMLKEKNVGVFFMNDNIYTLDSDGELRLTIMASIAQEESRKTSERVKWGQKRRMEQGVVFGNGCIFGYFLKDGKLTINPEEATIVRTIYERFLAGTGIHTICKELDAEGLRPKFARRWSQTTIYYLFKNEKYVGDLIQRKELTTDFLTRKTIKNPNDEDLIVIRDNHEPIVSREMWDNAQEELKRRATPKARALRHSNRYWCSGKLICGECGKTYASKHKKVHNKIHHYFWCLSSARDGKRKTDSAGNILGCDNLAIRETSLRYLVDQVMLYIDFNKDALIKEMVSEIETMQQGQEHIRTDGHFSKIEELKKKKARAIDLVLEGLISNEDLKSQNDKYDEDIKTLLKQVADIEYNNNQISHKGKVIKSLLAEIEKILLFDEDRTLAYKNLIDKILICKDKTVIIYLVSLDFGIKIKYKTTGVFTLFKIEIEEITLVERRHEKSE